jgi:hypothetical protein
MGLVYTPVSAKQLWCNIQWCAAGSPTILLSGKQVVTTLQLSGLHQQQPMFTTKSCFASQAHSCCKVSAHLGLNLEIIILACYYTMCRQFPAALTVDRVLYITSRRVSCLICTAPRVVFSNLRAWSPLGPLSCHMHMLHPAAAFASTCIESLGVECMMTKPG